MSVQITMDYSALRNLQAGLQITNSDFKKEFKQEMTATANALRRKAATYAPRRAGFLDKPRISSKLFSEPVNMVGYQWDIDFWTDYAVYLETKPWGPVIGNPYRPGTARKQRRLGTPIGWAYTLRAARDFTADLRKGAIDFKVSVFGDKLELGISNKLDVTGYKVL